MVSILVLLELAARKYPAVRLRQVEKDTATALGAGELEKQEHLQRQKKSAASMTRSSGTM